MSTTVASTAKKTSTTAVKKSTAPKGPSLIWNQERSAALVHLLRVDGVRTMPDLIRGLQSSPAFAGEISPITSIKVRNQLDKLNKLGLDLPKVGPGRGGNLDVAALQAIGLPSGAEAQ